MKVQGKGIKYLILMLVAIPMLFTACKKEQSSATGWNFNDPKNGGFQKIPYLEQETGPGLVLIEGGRFTMGRVEQEVHYDWNNIPRTVTVSSFYMDETEVTNFMYLEYLYWLDRVYSADYPEVYKKALPDTLVWRSKLAYNEPYVEFYLRHPAYRDYPVVGVNWLQANDYCAWRTDRVNEIILIREGLFEHYPNQINEDNFNTDAYIVGQYESGKRVDGIPDLNPNKEYRNVTMEDGILLPEYRLPTEAEWEYAAYGLIGNTIDELIPDRKLYPWNGHAIRNSNDKYIGQILANFKRGRGDNMGVAGKLNDNADITAPVYSYWPNDYGLYNMAGNVSEWVMDVYRPLTGEDADDFRPFRGNVYKTKALDEDGAIMEKDSLGHIIRRDVDPLKDNLQDRRNYKQADNINYMDGHWESNIYYGDMTENPKLGEEDPLKSMYEFGKSSLINDKARVYKGASWKDRAYWAVPGTRRYLTEDQSTPYIGFRCAMTRVGSPIGMGY
ncbi:MAG: gliding motility lipoprotein GldJ [Flavobacteriales bacterium CG_4_10_14_0_2_um_filter_32_8]|nr:MAG: gliding motility lipoprotein GldJ [Flavobacteriales bacterium CG_4_10_14_0_2_um_filter_32_8]PJB16193.1 MAG: gliding motility lipoprotein GldJ [Flavobacteriales bacterium CG_4_9_14_3_um_filter_32_8]